MNYITNGSESVVMGSGDLYAMQVKDIADVFNLTAAEEAKLTYLGFIESNAVLKAETDKQDITAANAGKVGSFTKDKTVTFKTGILSWCLENVSKFLTGSNCVTDTTTGKTIFTYAHEDKAPNVYLRFVSADESAGKKITINILCCSFSGELAFDFNNDDPVTFDYTFDCLSQKNPTTKKHDYYLVIYEDIIDTLTVTSAAGTTTGKTAITVSPSLTSGNTYRYKTAATVAMPTANEVLTSWTTWDGTTEITATTGNDIVIAEVDSSNKAKKAGKTNVVSKS